jgi:hypothetical protein
MSADKDQDPLLKWGHEAAIALFVVAMLAAVVIIIMAAVAGDGMGSATTQALIILGVGAALGYGVLRMRKSRERSVRPDWMGSTTQWRDGIKSKITADDKTNPPSGS